MRLKKQGFSAREYILSMSRQDIANYLGLAAETVSRIFKRFEADQTISVNHRKITLNDMRALQILSCRHES